MLENIKVRVLFYDNSYKTFMVDSEYGLNRIYFSLPDQ